MLDCVVVEEVAGFEIVGGIEQELRTGEQCRDVCGDEICNVSLDGNFAVEAGDLAASGLGLGRRLTRIFLIEKDLPLQVAGLDEVAVDEREATDAGSREQRGDGGTGGADAEDGNVSRGETGLASDADRDKESLARVAVEGLGGVVPPCG